MKKSIFCRDRERNEYRREVGDRLKNRPTFDRFPEQILFPMNLYKLK